MDGKTSNSFFGNADHLGTFSACFVAAAAAADRNRPSTGCRQRAAAAVAAADWRFRKIHRQRAARMTAARMAAVAGRVAGANTSSLSDCSAGRCDTHCGHPHAPARDRPGPAAVAAEEEIQIVQIARGRQAERSRPRQAQQSRQTGRADCARVAHTIDSEAVAVAD